MRIYIVMLFTFKNSISPIIIHVTKPKKVGYSVMLFLGGRSNYEYFDILSNNCVETSLVKLINNQTMSTSMFFFVIQCL